ncbi:hypothetical protein KAR91_62665 [Candidatus Pacearchaeota archaeon]|nr:hypothetical protein [Candidatus Pacearchaeota archaeon]
MMDLNFIIHLDCDKGLASMVISIVRAKVADIRIGITNVAALQLQRRKLPDFVLLISGCVNCISEMSMHLVMLKLAMANVHCSGICVTEIEYPTSEFHALDIINSDLIDTMIQDIKGMRDATKEKE